MERVAVRIWLPDAPGVLGQVATGIGRIHGNVTALEVMERDGGVAVDELIVELSGANAVEALCTELRLIPEVGIEEVRPIPAGAQEHGVAVLDAATEMVVQARGGHVLRSLVDSMSDLFEAEWVALVDLDDGTCPLERGDPPPVAWLTAFVGGAHFEDVGGATAGSGVLAGVLPRNNLALCLGRSVAFRGRERREVEMLSRMADACLDPGRAGAPPR